MLTTHHAEAEDIMALLDGELSATEAASLHEHLSTCAACAQIEQGFLATSRALQTWTVAEASASLDHDVLATADAPAPESPLHWKRWVAGLASVAALAAVFIAASRRQDAFFQKQVSVAALQSLREEPHDLAMTRAADGRASLDEAAAPPPPPPAPLPQQLRESKAVIGGGGGMPPASSTDSLGKLPNAPLIARTATLAISVPSVLAARHALESTIAAHQGYVASLDLSAAQNAAPELSASARVPAPQLDAALHDLRALGAVQHESQSGEEVTQQAADLDARLKTARDTEARFEAILRDRTGKLSDVLDVEEQIAEKRGEIEQMESEQKALNHRVDYARIDLTLTELYREHLDAPATLSGRLRNAFIDGLRSAGDALLSLILFLEESLPTLCVAALVLALPAAWLWRRYRRLRSAA